MLKICSNSPIKIVRINLGMSQNLMEIQKFAVKEVWEGKFDIYLSGG